jgi:DNA-binding MarR family transcriptional regulator
MTTPALQQQARTGRAQEDASAPTLLYLIGRIDRVVRRRVDEVVKARGLSVNQYTTLSVLDRRSGLSNAQLARRALVSPQSMNEVLLALERRGLVRRHAHPDHGRILQARLTAKGRRVLASCDADVREVEAAMVSDLSPQEQAALRHALLSGVRALHGGLEHD